MFSRSFIGGLLLGVLLIVGVVGGAVADRAGKLPWLEKVVNSLPVSWKKEIGVTQVNETRKVLNEESIVIDVAEKVSPSVVTVGIKKTEKVLRGGSPFGGLGGDPFLDPFGRFFSPPQVGERNIEHDIGSGFVVSADGLIVTNKHVVSDPEAEYKVFTSDDKEYKGVKIDRDPVNDLAILKIDPSAGSGLKPVELGDSDGLKVGQFAVAIGTALGEFRHTVTTGVISGLGRGITAGDGMGQMSEELDNVIQTDAAINPGNSGGPLLNSAGQVIGINVAVAQGSENIGFALPINLVKEGLKTFNERGGFGSRAFLGVQYSMISKKAALANEVPEGAYVEDVVADSPAEKAGLKVEDIVIKIDGQAVKDLKGGLGEVISKKKVGDEVTIEYSRDGETKQVKVKLEATK